MSTVQHNGVENVFLVLIWSLMSTEEFLRSTQHFHLITDQVQMGTSVHIQQLWDERERAAQWPLHNAFTILGNPCPDDR